ncbi:hypothetical protein Tco_0345502 [Tanacetum coccineum]
MEQGFFKIQFPLSCQVINHHFICDEERSQTSRVQIHVSSSGIALNSSMTELLESYGNDSHNWSPIMHPVFVSDDLLLSIYDGLVSYLFLLLTVLSLERPKYLVRVHLDQQLLWESENGWLISIKELDLLYKKLERHVVGREKNSSYIRFISCLNGGTNGVEGGGFERVMNWVLQESFHEARVLNCFVQKPFPSAHQNRHGWFQ